VIDWLRQWLGYLTNSTAWFTTQRRLDHARACGRARRSRPATRKLDSPIAICAGFAFTPQSGPQLGREKRHPPWHSRKRIRIPSDDQFDRRKPLSQNIAKDRQEWSSADGGFVATVGNRHRLQASIPFATSATFARRKKSGCTSTPLTVVGRDGAGVRMDEGGWELAGFDRDQSAQEQFLCRWISACCMCATRTIASCSALCRNICVGTRSSGEKLYGLRHPAWPQVRALTRG